MKYSELIKQNKLLEKDDNKYNISLLSNIMVHQLKDILEYSLRINDINANVTLGDYDNIIQDSSKFSNSNVVLIYWELANIIDGLQYKANLLSKQETIDIIEKVKYEIDITLQNLKETSLVIINKFSSLVFNSNNLELNNFDYIAEELNQYLNSRVSSNIKIIDINKIISNISIEGSIDLRYFTSSKTLYSINFYKEYSEYIKPLFLNTNGKIKKALIFDCDNTLWKGILGEDGFENIKMFKEIQSMAVKLSKKGVIIGLCSKNNPKDVDEVLLNHKEMLLRDKNIVIKKVNWNDKASNLKSISKELNIGLDSLVFLDDSDFEVNLIKEKVSQVDVFQVPKSEYEYAKMMRKNILPLFYNPSITNEDIKKLDMYKSQIKRVEAEQSIGDIETYLKSLDLQIVYNIDDESQIKRISQMTQKTNQFNLTTKRYTEQDIKKFIYGENSIVIAISVSDKFGDNGIIGVTIIELENHIANIDTLLMSCRVLGRNVEYKFMDIIVEKLKHKKVDTINATYSKTLKNEQVSDLYDRFGFDILTQDDSKSNYRLDIDRYQTKDFKYIGVKSGR